MDTYIHMEPDPSPPWHPSYPTALSFTTRTETLRKYAAQAAVDRRALEDDPAGTRHLIDHDLRHRLNRDIATAGRQIHGDTTLETHEDHLRNQTTFRLSCLTRERTDGQWPDVWAAIHQDEEDRREALRHPSDDLED
jgi:hypothetical protein